MTAPSASAPRRRVLIAEDEPDHLDLLRQVCDHPSLEVVVAQNGVEAVAMARELKPDVILLDSHMPAMDGFEVFQILRQDPGTSAAKVIFVSGHAEAGALLLAKDFGAYASFRKPFDPHKLFLKVMEAAGLD